MLGTIESDSKLITSVKEPVLEDLLPIIIDVITEIGINKAEFCNFRNEISEKLCKAQLKQEKIDELTAKQSKMQNQIETLINENERLSEELKNTQISRNYENQNAIISKLKELLLNFENNWNSQKELEYENFVTKDVFHKLSQEVNEELISIKKEKKEKKRK